MTSSGTVVVVAGLREIGDNEEEARAGVARCSVTKIAWDKSFASAKLKMSMGRLNGPIKRTGTGARMLIRSACH